MRSLVSFSSSSQSLLEELITSYLIFVCVCLSSPREIWIVILCFIYFLQKKHALRCYCQAMQVYKGKGWSLAEDHINFTIGRQSYTLRQLDNAVSAFRHILINESKQSAAQQGAFLREYLYVYKVNTYSQKWILKLYLSLFSEKLIFSTI